MNEPTEPTDRPGPTHHAEPSDPRAVDALDELVAAVLDGEATDAERQRVLDDPTARARLEQFRSVAAVVAAPDPPDERRHEEAIAAALHAADDEPAPVAGPSDRWRSTARRGTVWAAAAAVLVVLLPLAALLLSRGRSQVETQAFRDVGSAIDGAESDASAGAAGDAPSTSTAREDLDASRESSPSEEGGWVHGDLGELSSTDELAGAARALLPDLSSAGSGAAPLPQTGPTSGPPPPDVADAAFACEATVRGADPNVGVLAAVSSATYAGIPAYVLVFLGATEPRVAQPVAIAVARAGCEELARAEL